MSESADNKTLSRRHLLQNGLTVAAGAGLAWTGLSSEAAAKSAAEIDLEVEIALEELFATVRGAETLYRRASGVLVIPRVIKGSFLVGGAYGEGALLIEGATDSYWSYGQASFGFQAGAQRTRQALFFMTPQALNAFVNSRTRGFEVGADAEVTVVETGAELSVDTTEDPRPIIGVVFGRAGLQGGASLQGGKYTRIVR